MATDDKREKTSRKTNARRDKKIEKKRAKISDPMARRLLDTMKSQKSSQAVPSAKGWK